VLDFRIWIESVLAFDNPNYKQQPKPGWVSDDSLDFWRQGFKQNDKAGRQSTLRDMKRQWNEQVDRQFIQSVHTIHWTKIDEIPGKLQNKYEISAEGYLEPPYINHWNAAYGGNDMVGLFLKGFVTLASNADLRTNQYTNKQTGMKYSEYFNLFILNRENFERNNVSGKSHNEFLLANWRAKAVVIKDQSQIPQIKQVAPNLPMIDIQGQPL